MLDLTRYCEYCEDANRRLAEWYADNGFREYDLEDDSKASEVYCTYCALMVKNGDAID